MLDSVAKDTVNFSGCKRFFRSTLRKYFPYAQPHARRGLPSRPLVADRFVGLMAFMGHIAVVAQASAVRQNVSWLIRAPSRGFTYSYPPCGRRVTPCSSRHFAPSGRVSRSREDVLIIDPVILNLAVALGI